MENNRATSPPPPPPGNVRRKEVILKPRCKILILGLIQFVNKEGALYPSRRGRRCCCFPGHINLQKNALYLSVNVFSTKVLLGDTFFYVVAPTEDEASILRGHPSHAKV